MLWSCISLNANDLPTSSEWWNKVVTFGGSSIRKHSRCQLAVRTVGCWCKCQMDRKTFLRSLLVKFSVKLRAEVSKWWILRYHSIQTDHYFCGPHQPISPLAQHWSIPQPISLFLILIFPFLTHANSSPLLYDPWTRGLSSTECQEGSLSIISI